MLVILDAGHGIETQGKRSPGKKTWDDGKTGIVEYEFNRDIVRRISASLESLGIDTHVICQDEHTMSLSDRKSIARTMANEYDGDAVLISVHANASGNKWSNARGVTVFTCVDPDESTMYLAQRLGEIISFTSNMNYRGIKFARLSMLSGLPFPAVLTENGFMTSKEDCKILASESGRQAIADGHVNAICLFPGVR